MSLMSVEEAEAYKAQIAERMRAAGKELPASDHAFDDMTDFENPNFMYVL